MMHQRSLIFGDPTGARMLFTSLKSNSALVRESTPVPAENLLAGRFPALGRMPGDAIASATPSRCTRTGRLPLEGPVAADLDSNSRCSAVKLLPTADAIETSGLGPNDCAKTRGSIRAETKASARTDLPGTGDNRIDSRTTEPRDQRTWSSTADRSRDSEPFHGGTTGMGGFVEFADQISVLVGCVDEKVAVGGSADVIEGPTPDEDPVTARTLGSATNSPLFLEFRVFSALPGADTLHDTLPWPNTPGPGFSTRVGAVQPGWCDVSSTNQCEPSDVSSDLKAMVGDNSFLAPECDLSPMHLEDGIDDTTDRRTSFRGTLRGSIVPGRKSTRTSRFDDAIRIPVSPEQSIHGSRDHCNVETPDSVMLVDFARMGGGDLDGWTSVGGAGFSVSFLSGRC
jgi:hypothetical protein